MAENDLENSTTEAPYVVGKVVNIFFQNTSNFYKVMLVKVEETNLDWHEDEIVVTGSFGEVQEEESYRFYGRLVNHARYGQQLQVENYQQEKPTSKNGLVQYLSGDKFPGIGKVTAQKIVDRLGMDAVDKIIEDGHVLDGLLKKDKQLQLINTLTENNGMEQIIIGLNGFGFGSQLAFNIYQIYEAKTLDIIHENPYQLVEDVEGVGFNKADNIATNLGFAADSPGRLQAGIIHALNQSCLMNGDTFSEAQPLLLAAMNVLEKSRNYEINPDALVEQLVTLEQENRLVIEENHVFIPSIYYSEVGIASQLDRLVMQESPKIKADLAKEIRHIEKVDHISYGESQIETIKAALKSKAFILTGGPGTGKTTVINAIVNIFAEINGLSLDINEYKDTPFPVLLAAPTGRAAKRMSETTGLPAATIHRHLGLSGRMGNAEVAAKELEGGLLIVDEMSMVDTWLFNTLLKAVPSHMQVILVGDKDQLPSVGPGQVFHDLIASGVIPMKELNEIYRQGDESSVIPLAHAIKNGELPADFTAQKTDRSFIACHASQVQTVVSQIVKKAAGKSFSAQDIQVLAPMYRGEAGIDALNQMIQGLLNGNESGKRKEVRFNDKIFRIGDKILHLVNNPEQNVFNGDIGEIVGISLAKENDDKVDTLIMDFSGQEVSYKRNDWIKITLAYCTSIHKAQGSEFEMVLLPMVHQYSRMLQRNLLYTAVTRAKRLLILIGEPSAFEQAVKNESVNRQTSLTERVQEFFENRAEFKQKKMPTLNETVEKPKKSTESTEISEEVTDLPLKMEQKSIHVEPEIEKSFILTKKMVLQQQIDPMIGMTDITPLSFKK